MQGVLLLSFGGSKYAQWAVNMACSLRFFAPNLQIAIGITEDTLKEILPEERGLFDKIIDIAPYLNDEWGYFSPAWVKLNMDKISPFKKTIYLDVDGICTKNIEPLFDIFEQRDMFTQVITNADLNKDTKWNCQWASLDFVGYNYKVNYDIPLPEINSSILGFTDTAKDFFEQARANYLYDYSTHWGASFPDELAFNVALNQTKRELTPMRYIAFDTYEYRNNKNMYLLGLYGEYTGRNSFLYNEYNRIAQQVNRSVLNRHNVYKAHNLMKRKFVSNKIKPNKSEKRKEYVLNEYSKYAPLFSEYSIACVDGFNMATDGINIVTRIAHAPDYGASSKLFYNGKCLDLLTEKGVEDGRLCGEYLIYTDNSNSYYARIVDGRVNENKKINLPKELGEHKQVKNLSPVLIDGELWLIFNHTKEVVAFNLKGDVKRGKGVNTDKFIAGGTNLIAYKGGYLGVSHVKNKIKGLNAGAFYTANLYTMDKNFNITSYVEDTLFMPPYIDKPRLNNGAFVVFPCSIYEENDNFVINGGLNDLQNFELSIKSSTLEEILKKWSTTKSTTKDSKKP